MNVFFVTMHSNITSRPLFDPPQNVLTLFTGEGQIGLGMRPSYQNQRDLLQRFFPRDIKTTIDFLLGGSGFSEPEVIKSLYYAVHGDLANGRHGALDVDLSLDQEDIQSGGYWGIYKLDWANNTLQPIPITLPFETTSRHLIQTLADDLPNELNIVLFEGCRGASSKRGAEQYANTVASLAGKSHYSLSLQSSPHIPAYSTLPPPGSGSPNMTSLYRGAAESSYNPYYRSEHLFKELDTKVLENAAVSRLGNSMMEGGVRRQSKTKRARRRNHSTKK